uniref:Plastid movement impaired 2 n=1 Tax=Noccaea caerulescens TaxID=107243 RepID=A0A1J3CEU6_NOCCA
MGNSITLKRKKAKVMKIDGEILRIKTPVTTREVTADYPGYVLLDSEAVKHFGVRAKPLEQSQILKPKKTYFLVELPKLPPETTTTTSDTDNKLPYRRVMSGIHVGAKERLEMLMLSRRTVSDITVVRSDGGDGPGLGLGPGHTSVRLRLPRSQINKLMEESHDGSEIAEKILSLYRESSGEIGGGRGGGDSRRNLETGVIKAREKQVSFAGEGGRELPVLWSRKER